MTREQKREALKERIAAARARFGDRSPEDIASDAASAAFQYAKQNPVVVIGGALALGLALGDRADSGVVRPGARRAEITAVFDLSKLTDVNNWLEERGWIGKRSGTDPAEFRSGIGIRCPHALASTA